ncbi:hypothetical protein ACFL4G_02355 [Thermodesulfobacteriota bacterium]
MKKGRQGTALIVAVVGVVIAGCGIPSSPKPVGLKGPEAVKDLRAEISDGAVVLAWSLPKRCADGLKADALGGYRVLKDDGRGFENLHEVDFSAQGLALMQGRRITFKDETVKAGGSVRYQVITWDARGDRSGASNVVTVTLDPVVERESTQERRDGR